MSYDIETVRHSTIGVGNRKTDQNILLDRLTSYIWIQYC